MDLGLTGKLVLVTGSTKGIGKAIALEFIRNGAHTIVNGRSAAEVDRVTEELNQAGLPGKAISLAGDVSSPEGEAQVASFIASLGQPLEVLVNNVGIFDVKDFFAISDEEWERYYQVNVMSAVRLSRRFLKEMIDRKSGRILMIASEAGVRTLPHMVAYSVSKTSMIGLARSLSQLTKGVPGVTVNSVLAGPTWTEGVENYIANFAASKNISVEQAVAEYFKTDEPTSLLQRFLDPKEIADVVVFLASARASGINGHSQRVEGGIIHSI